MVNPQAHVSLGCNYLSRSICPENQSLFNKEIDGPKPFQRAFIALSVRGHLNSSLSSKPEPTGTHSG